MKKQLLATTALAVAGAVALSGAALAQDKKMMKPSVTIFGWYEQTVGFVDSDQDGLDGFHTTFDNEVTFVASTELDNGLRVRGEVDLAGNTDREDQINEAFMAVGGSFGEIRIGANDEAAYEMTFGYHGTVSTEVGNITLEFDVGSWIPDTNGLWAGDVRVNRSSDADLIAYYTPRFSGFQFGASYSRSGDEDTDGIESDTLGPIATPDAEWGVGDALETEQDNDIFSVATNYVGEFGDVGVAIAFGYVTADVPNQRVDDLGSDTVRASMMTTDDVSETLNLDTRESWGGGIQVDFSGVRLGVGYVRYDDTTASIAAVDVDGDGDLTNDDNTLAIAYRDRERERWDVGARYTMGSHSFRIGYINLSEDGSKLETSAGILTYARTLGPGVTWGIDAMWADYESVDGTSTDGTAITTGISISF